MNMMSLLCFNLKPFNQNRCGVLSFVVPIMSIQWEQNNTRYYRNDTCRWRKKKHIKYRLLCECFFKCEISCMLSLVVCWQGDFKQNVLVQYYFSFKQNVLYRYVVCLSYHVYWTCCGAVVWSSKHDRYDNNLFFFCFFQFFPLILFFNNFCSLSA